MKIPPSLLPAALGAAFALGAVNAAAAPSVTVLDPYVVTGVPLEDSINPLTRETDGVMGDARNPLGAPRAYSTITAALVNERAIHGLGEILAYSPGAYAPASYGELTVAYLRGDVAESYVNGQRRSDNLYGFLPSFNGVEAVDVVRGPGSVVFGASYLTGGYVNYVTKQPQFAGPATTVTLRLGDWVPDSRYSYFNGSVQVDTTAPVSDTFAWRLSYEGKAGDTFFHRAGVKDDRQDLFAAATWKPREGVTVAFNAQWLGQNAPESLGVNRITQDLVWHDRYLTGLSADLPYNPGPIPATGVVRLPRDATLYSLGDFAQAHVGSAQLIVTRAVAPGLTLINRSLYEQVSRQRFNQVEYLEYVRQHTFENRSEAHLDWSAGPRPQSIIAGVTVRYAAVKAFENYANEYLYNFDLSQPGQRFNQAQAFPDSYYPGAPGPGGRPFFSPVDPVYPTPETGDSRVWNPAVFAQDEIKLGGPWSLLAGVRGDRFSARARDPLPPPGTSAVSASAQRAALSGNASLLFRPTRSASYYLTYQDIAALHGNLGGGGISLRSDGAIDPHDLSDRSTLVEAGAKYSLRDNQLFLSAATFSQERTRTSLGDVHNDIRIRGLELEAVYQPDTHLSATLNGTWQDGRYLHAAPFQLGGRSIYDAIALGRGPGGRGTATNDFSPFSDQVPVGDWPLVGFSRLLVNGSLRYRGEKGFGAGTSLQWQSAQRGNLDNEWHLPAEYTLNASVFYEARRWSANLDFLNLTDQRNWIHNGDAYTASELMMQALPFRVEGYLKLKF